MSPRQRDMTRMLQKLARDAKAASARISAVADCWRERTIDLEAARARRQLGDAAPPPSWDVEREAFLRRLAREDEAS